MSNNDKKVGPSSTNLVEGLQPLSSSSHSRSRSVSLQNIQNRNSIPEKFRGCLPELSRRQWQFLAVFAVADFIAGIVYNIKGPFYPLEAEKKGVSSTQYGFVFGIFELTKVFVCPIFGKNMSQMGPKKVFIFAMTLIASCSIAFGLLDFIENSTIFLTLSLIIRILEAIGSAGFSTASFSIIACEFPTTVATTFASLETFFGIGLIVGPLFGGILFTLGGYQAPFIATGLALFIVALAIASIMPTPQTIFEKIPDNVQPRVGGYGMFSILKIPGVLLAAFGVFAVASSTGFVNATLEPHIRQFNLTPVEVGIVFVIYGTVYAMTAPLWGSICDRVTQPKLISLTGASVNFIAFLLIGPAPFLQFDPILWVTCIGLVLHGLALGATFVSGFVLSLRYAISSGFPNNMSTYGVVSGLWTSILSLGMFVGPSVGGILIDEVGFRWGSVYVLVSMMLLIFFIISFLLKYGLQIMTIEAPEAEPLLANQQQVTQSEQGHNQSPSSYGAA